MIYLQFESIMTVFSDKPNGFSSDNCFQTKLTKNEAFDKELNVRPVEVASELEHVAYFSSNGFELLSDIFKHELVLSMLILRESPVTQLPHLSFSHLINGVFLVFIGWTFNDSRYWRWFLCNVYLFSWENIGSSLDWRLALLFSDRVRFNLNLISKGLLRLNTRTFSFSCSNTIDFLHLHLVCSFRLDEIWGNSWKSDILFDRDSITTKVQAYCKPLSVFLSWRSSELAKISLIRESSQGLVFMIRKSRKSNLIRWDCTLIHSRWFLQRSTKGRNGFLSQLCSNNGLLFFFQNILKV